MKFKWFKIKLVMKSTSKNNVKIAFALNLVFAILEIIGGFLTNSVSILSDAIHDLGDVISIGLSWFLDNKSLQKPDKKYTYGYLRFSLLGAFINSVVLSVGSIIMIYTSATRLFVPQKIEYDGMILFSIFGIIINGFATYKTAKGKSFSEKIVSLHLLEDVLGWVSVFICAIIMKIFDLPWLDPILSISIAVIILLHVFKNLKKILHVFLEKAPNNVNLENINREIKSTQKEIVDIHHVHIWSLDGINNCASLHIVLNDNIALDKINKIKSSVKKIFKSNNVSHITIETEFLSENCDGSCCFDHK